MPIRRAASSCLLLLVACRSDAASDGSGTDAADTTVGTANTNPSSTAPTTQDDDPDATSVDGTGSSDDTSDSDSDSDAESDTDEPIVCTEIGFAASAAAWSLPPIPNTNSANDPVMNTARDLDCDDGGCSRVATIDMDGDALPDLVHTDDCGTGGLGLTTWDVYLNDGTGFADAATSWSLPAIPNTNPANDPVMNLYRDLDCEDGGYSRIATVDMDGDALPDLVHTDDCGTGGLGLTTWDVYRNDGTGFADEPIAWSLPAIPMTNPSNDPMMNLYRDLDCENGGYSRIATVDMDGDALPDLVHTDDCGTGGLGLTTWDVYLNDGTGFADAATSWSLPAIESTNPSNDPVMNLYRDLDCEDGGYSRIATVDMDGDARPDLVHTDDCGTGGLGLTTWAVYLNDGSGFADEPIAWTLPPVESRNLANDPMMNLARDLECDDGGYSRIATVDIDGDHRPDLLHTDDCGTGGLGLETWDVYLNTGTGFGERAAAWSLPPIPMTNLANDPMMNLYRDLDCNDGGYSRIATMDLDGDALPEIVHTDDCATGGLGLATWDVYWHPCSGR